MPIPSAQSCRLETKFLSASCHGSSRHAPPRRLWALTVRPASLSKLHSGFSRTNDRRWIHICPVFLPPVLFTGLFVSLWIWKCAMLVVFQNKIIYMPGLPPNARSETIADYAHLCGGIRWREEKTKASDGTSLGIAVATITVPSTRGSAHTLDGKLRAHVYVLYFQGNASSIPPRLPDLSWVLHAISDGRDREPVPLELTFVCLSYRGYWTSKGRPSETGIRLDAEAGMRWVADQHQKAAGSSGEKPIVLVWGQSIGSGVATNLAATGRLPDGLTIDGLLLETPFLSVRAMVGVLYPQKWLPYQYLWPFLRNQLDSWSNLGLIAGSSEKGGGKLPNIFILEADRDELVPKAHGEALFQRCRDLGIPVEKGAAPVAYHSEAIARGEGKKMAAQALMCLTKRALDQQGRR
ncbi:protein bem46 [Podospora aff. communis PSN243]|uniref:Protein bem46 n=1 Tax=Podospora aff. communis PSN243 TaxID=3040156 RepID=A0AAV9GUM3_9PEZI|nr:protein bem46 [Podospora aff. communis PSN243]